MENGSLLVVATLVVLFLTYFVWFKGDAFINFMRQYARVAYRWHQPSADWVASKGNLWMHRVLLTIILIILLIGCVTVFT